jgi:hypothetical protein
VEWATNATPMVTVSGPGFLDVTSWQDTGAIVIHLVNLTNPMAMKGPYREFFPVGEQKIKVRLPEGINAKAVHLLVADRSAAAQRQDHDQEVTITVPSILDHEVVAIDI